MLFVFLFLIGYLFIFIFFPVFIALSPFHLSISVVLGLKQK